MRRRKFISLLGAAVPRPIGPDHAQSDPAYVATYLDVMPNETNSGAVFLHRITQLREAT
jgi:hypothetical protein